MKRFLQKNIVAFILLLPVMVMAQPGAISTNNLTGAGAYNCTALTDYGNFRQARIQSGTASSGVTWEFPATCAFPGDIWRPYAAGTPAVNFNTVMDPSVSTNSGRYNSGNGGNSGTLAATTLSNYYTFNVQEVTPTSNAFMAVLQTTYNPAGITSVATVGNSATINVTLAAAKNASEYIYIRWHTGAGFGSATITPVTTLLSGTTYTVNLPGLVNGQTITYYVFTSNQSAGLTNANSDYFTLNVLNNGTANYSYVYGANTYYWVGGTAGTLTTATTTVLSTTLGGPAANVTLTTIDKIIFDGTDISSTAGLQTGNITLSNTLAALSFGQLVLQNNTNVTYNPSAAFDITLNGGTGADLSIANGSVFSFGAASNPRLNVLTGATGSISGTVNIGVAGAGAQQLVGADASAITFQSGSICTVNSASGTFPFGTGTTGSIVFANGATIKHTKSDDIFGGSLKTVVTFQTGSTYEYNGTTGTYFNFRLGGSLARTYADVVINSTTSFNTGSYSNNPTVDNFIVAATALTSTIFDLQDAGHTLTIKGNLINNNTSALNFAPNVSGTATINFSGTGTQNIINKTGSTAGINFGTTSTSRLTLVNITSGATVRLGNGVDAGNLTLTSPSGVSANTVFTVKASGTLDMLTNVIYGLGVNTGGSFTVEAGGTVKTGHLSGLSTTASTGAVQTQTKSYNSGANYVLNGTTGTQSTGNFIASTTTTANTVNNFTVDNTSGVTFSIASGTLNVNGTLFLTNGIFNAITNTALVVIPSGAGVTRTNGWVYGSLRKYVNASTNFETGDNLYYTNVTIGGAITTAGLFTVKTNPNGDHPNIGSSDMDGTKSENTYWSLTNNAVVFTAGATLAFNYPNGDIDAGATATNFKVGRYAASAWTYPTPITPAANSISVSAVSIFGDFQAAEASCGAFGTWKGTVSTDWNDAANWCGGVPTVFTDVIIPNAANQPLIAAADAFAKTVTINSGSVLSMSGVYNLTIAGSSFTNNAGTTGFAAAAATGAVIFTGATAAISGTTILQNVTVSNSGLDFGTASTVNGIFKINSGGYVNNSHPPIYACTSTLLYNNGGTYNRGSEWKSGVTTGQPGYPGNVQLSTTGTNFIYGSNAAAICNTLTIDAGTTFDMGTAVNNSLTVGSDINANGNFYLSMGSGGDVYLGGNYTVGTGGVVFNNNRATFFNGASGTQTITKTGNGTVYFDYMVVNKASGDVKLSNLAGSLTNVQINSSVNNASIYVLELRGGDIDLNDRSFILNGTVGNSTNIFTAGTGVRRIYTSTGTGNFDVIGSAFAGVQNLNVSRASAASSLTFDANVTLATSVGVDFGPSGMTLINSILQINANGFCINNSPNYGSASFLIYNNGGGGFNRNVEWNNNTAGAGYPNNVIVQNNTPVTMDGFAFTAAGLGTTGYVDIKSGSSLMMGTLAKNISVGTDITISGTLSLSTVAGGDIFVAGNWTRTGTFTQNNRNVTFNGSLNGTITATGGQDFSFAYISKNAKANKLTLADNVNITEEIGFNTGTIDVGTNNKFLTIVSTAAKTARVAQSDSANTAFVYGATDKLGQFIVQRYIPARRSWRLMTAPLKPSGGSHSVSEAWQERGNPLVGLDYTAANWVASVTADSISSNFGTQITGGTTGNGFDQSPNNNTSIKYYNTGSWLAPANINSTSVNSQEGWMLFLRGDRKNYGEITNQYKTPTVTTLRPRGQLFIGRKSITSAGMTVVGNPYASAVDFNSMTRTGSGWPANPTYYVWDPYLGGATGQGAFVTLTWNGTNFTRTSPYGAGTYDDRYIPSGAAIMVDFPAGGGTLNFAETDKNAANTTTAFRPVTNQLMTVLNTVNPDHSTYVSDGVLSLFDNSFNNAADINDPLKLSNFTENFGLARDGKLLSVERRRTITAADTIFYNIAKMQRKNYQFQFIMNGLDLPASTAAFLEDLYLKKKTPVSLQDTTRIDFSIAVNEEAAADRFRLVFRRSVQYSSVNAFVLNSDIAVNWVVNDELNIAYYQVERSLNGERFDSIGTRQSNGDTDKATGYNWLDVTPAPGEYYYRVKSVSRNGVITYSDAVKVKMVKSSPALYVFPNPVINHTIQLQLNSAAPGLYAASLFNNSGQLISSESISHTGGTATKIIKPTHDLTSGNYQLKITAPGGKISVIKVIVVNE